MSKVVPILPEKAPGKKPAGPDALARLEKLEDAMIAALQDIRKIKSELTEQTDAVSFEKLIDTKAVAECFGEDPRYIARQAKAKKIPGIRIGKEWKFSPSALQKWLEEKSRAALDS